MGFAVWRIGTVSAETVRNALSRKAMDGYMKKRFLLSLISAAVIFSSAAQAAGIDSVRFDTAGATLTVSGTAEGGSGVNMVTLRVFAPGKTAENVKDLSLDEQKAAIEYLYQTELGSDGGFSFTYHPQNIADGNHKIYVTAPDGSMYSQYVLMLNKDTAAELISDLNAADTKEKMYAALTKHNYVLTGVETIDEIAAKHPDNDLTDLISGMLAGMKFTDAASVSDAAADAAIVADINLAKDGTEITKILADYGEILKISENPIYKTLFLSFADKVSEKFVNQEYKNTQEFLTSFFDTVITEKINSVSNYTGVSAVFDASRDYLTAFNFDRYDKLSDSQKVYVQKKVADSGDYKNVSEIEKVFNNAVKNPPSENNGGSGGGGGGSSSSGGKKNTSSSGNAIGISKDTGSNGDKKDIFDDLSSAEWARESILALYEKGIVSGMGENKFDPSGRVTREQFAKMIVSACGKFEQNAECNFTDTDKNAWYAPYVASAANAGIVFGIDESNFGIGRNITREDMAVMIYRAAGMSAEQADELFADDSELSDYAREAVYTLKAKKIMSGKGDNRFEPKAYATRAEAARMIYSLIELGGAV